MSGGIFKPVSLNSLKPGNLYRWDPTASLSCSGVPFFHVSDLNRFLDCPKENTVIMYLGRENTGSLDAYMLLIGDQKYAVYNDDFRYGLKEV